MPKLNLTRIAFSASLILMLSGQNLSSQFGNTYYHMYGVPQANQLNPAFQPGCEGYLAMPLIGPLRFEVESNSIGYGDIFEWNSATNKYMTFLHPQGNKQKFMDALANLNLIRAEVASNLISFGWRNEEWFFTFDLTERLIEGISFPKDFAEFLVDGNLYKTNFNFSDLAQNFKYFHELGIGVSYNLDDEMQFGVRAKFLMGGANSTTRTSEIYLKTTPDEWRIRSDVMFEATLPYLEDIPLDDEGYVDFDEVDSIGLGELFGFPDGIENYTAPSSLSTITGIKNPGFAVDLGFSYTPLEQLTVSASLVDLGFIRWRNYVYNFHQEMDYTFEGVEFRLEEDYDPGEDLLDSLKNDLRVKVSQDKYTTMLTGKVYLGAAYNITERIRIGGLFRTRIYNYRFYNQYTLSANFQPISMFSASLSYSIYGKSYMNLGLGLSLRAGPLNLYFVTDQAPSAYFFPQEFSSMNFRLGMNIVWGCTMPKGMKDRPLID
jgi:hypothetical protein